MHITLMHNSKAGDQTPNKTDLVAMLKRAGHKVTYQSTKEKDFARALDDPGEWVVVAGGDGTVRKVALRLIGRNVPIAVLPLGTANNFARALGLRMNPLEMIRSLPTAQRVALDVGMARGPWGDMPFLEGAGVGLFPRMISVRAWDKEHGVSDVVDGSGGVEGGRHLLWQTFDELRGIKFQLKLDGKEISGNSLLLEIMNTPSIGPALRIAPQANLRDGALDVVLVLDEERPRLERFLRATIERQYRPPKLRVQRARQIHLLCSATEVHFDDECWPDIPVKKHPAKARPRTIEIRFETLPGALSALIPKSGRGTRRQPRVEAT